MQCEWMKSLRVRSTTPTLDSQRSAWKETHGGDSEQPRDVIEAREQFVLISRHFYYFGASAIDIPEKFVKLGFEKRGPGFRRDFQTSPGLSHGSRPKNLGNTRNRV